jgi:glycosyltransferase involved in cell wall biosynthesis
MEERLPTVSVVICAYTLDRWGDLSEAVESVFKQSLPPDQIVLVVDHNESLFRRSATVFTGVEVVESREKPGLAGARNTGIDHCRTEIIAFLDDDAVAQPEWLLELVRPYADPKIAGTGGVVNPVWQRGQPDWFPLEFFWVVGCSYRGLPEIRTPIRNPIGAGMSFRRSVFTAVGQFDINMGRVDDAPLGCEETILGIKVVKYFGGSSIWHIPEAIVDHKVGFERASGRYFVRRCFAEGVSKAAVASRVGTLEGSSAERSYVAKVLPTGLVSGMVRFVRGEPAGLASSGLIVVGLACTVLGYLLERCAPDGAITRRLSRRA